MVNPTWRHGEIFGMGYFQEVEGFVRNFSFFFSLKAVIYTEKRSHETSLWLQSRTNFFS